MTTDTPVRSAAVQPRLGRVFAAAFVGFFLLAAGWAFAAPFDGPPDEFQHVLRAYGVVSGQITPRADARITVPQSLVPEHVSDVDSCFRQILNQTAACAGDLAAHPGDRTTMVVSGSGAANYNPLYYAIVGLPIKLSPDWTGVLAARLLTGALVAPLLAGAATVALALGRRKTRRTGSFLLAGVLALTTPVVINLSGAVNPAGLEIAAGVGLWAALLAVIDARSDDRRVFALLGFSAILLAVLREAGPVWLAGSLVVAALGLDRDRIRSLFRQRAFWIWTAVVAAAVAYGVLWILLSTQGGIRSTAAGEAPDHRIGHLWLRQFLHGIPYYTNGLVGSTGYGDVVIPFPLIVAWYVAMGMILVPAVRYCGRRVRLQIALGLALPYAILMYTDVQARSQGWSLSQGRYALPMLVGVPMLAAFHVGRRGVYAPSSQATLLRIGAAVLLPFQAVALWITMLRFQHGFTSKRPSPINLFSSARSLNPFTGDWLPPAGPVLPVVLCLAGIAALIAFYWWMARMIGAGLPVDDAENAGTGSMELTSSGTALP